MVKFLTRIAGGAVLAAAGIWLVTANLMNSIVEKTFDPELGCRVFRPGLVVDFRTEGCGVTHYGKHGLPGIPDIDAVSGPKVVIWGDSHVEAQQVDDAEKTAMQVTTQWSARHPDRLLTAASVGESGVGFAQHYFDIPRYERSIPGIIRHYLVITLPERALSSPGPYRPSQYAQYIDNGSGYELKERTEDSSRVKELFPVLNKLRLRLVYFLAGKMHRGGFTMRFKLGPIRKPPCVSAPPDFSKYFRDYCWLLDRLKEQTRLPITVIYTPYTPTLMHGKISFESSPQESKSIDSLRSACEMSGVGFIHLGDAFRATFEHTGLFCRGFVNTPPGSGHFNALGHRVLAEAIVKDLESHGL